MRTILPLDEDARPAVLQSCHPRGDSKYVPLPSYLTTRPSLSFGRLRDIISGLATVNTSPRIAEHEPTMASLADIIPGRERSR